MTGYSEDELLARTFTDITHPEDHQAEHPSLLRLVRGETDEYEGEKRYIRKDGNVTWAHVSVTMWAHVSVTMIRTGDGLPLRTVSVIQDITSRKRAEEALRESEEHQRLAVEAADLGVWYWDIRKERVKWNDRLLAMAGLPPGIEMTAERCLAVLHPEDRERVLPGVQHAVQNRTDYRDELRNVHPDGSVGWMHLIGRVLYGADGNPERMIGVASDITQRKHAEETLREASHRKDVFLAMLAHELRNPLVPIRNALKLLKLLRPGEPSSSRRAR